MGINYKKKNSEYPYISRDTPFFTILNKMGLDNQFHDSIINNVLALI